MLSTLQKLEILADAAKYDASCASSGAEKRDSKNGGLGSTSHGICHSYTPDGRCVSLLKILLTNACVFDCAYCINRRSSNVRRARFSVQEVVDLTLNFYRRNYIEGLFLSSGIIRSSDYTMELIVRVARSLREEHGFRGYIHLKSIPDADPALIAEAGRYADRLSINVELPTESGLKTFAPEKRAASIKTTMANLRVRIAESHADRRAPRFSPAGQGTQMIVGADGANDAQIVATSASLYASYDLQAHLLLGLQPDPGFEPPAAGQGGAARARAPPLSGRLALSLLRLLAPTRSSSSMRRRHARSRDRSETRLGLATSRALPS